MEKVVPCIIIEHGLGGYPLQLRTRCAMAPFWRPNLNFEVDLNSVLAFFIEDFWLKMIILRPNWTTLSMANLLLVVYVESLPSSASYESLP